MRAIVQRVEQANVTINDITVGEIGPGIVLFLGIAKDDSESDIHWLAEKIVHLRIFEDKKGKMNTSLQDNNYPMLIVSQFTLYGDCRKGRRPGFSAAAPPDKAKLLYEQFVRKIKKLGVSTATGQFQAEMKVELINDGPVTFVLDTDFRKQQEINREQ